jgi:hypothetical protein
MKKLFSLILIIATTSTFAAEGFQSMFNGKDVSQWNTAGNWFPNDRGELEIKPREGEKGWKRFDAYLYSKKQYRNFVFDFEYKHPKGGNSGFFFRIPDPSDPVGAGFEVQINDIYGKTTKLTAHDCGGVIGTAAPTTNASKPAGEWNRMIVTMKNDDLKVELNGKPIVDIDLKKTAKKALPETGYISLQDHGLNLFFRNLRLKELD